jgi:hypothetical protein
LGKSPADATFIERAMFNPEITFYADQSVALPILEVVLSPTPSQVTYVIQGRIQDLRGDVSH